MDTIIPMMLGENRRLENRRRFRQAEHCLVVFDDDPTGCQTMHGVPVVTDWDQGRLEKILGGSPGVVYVLTNTRSMASDQAAAVLKDAASTVQEAARQTGTAVLFLSRSDSTLRGHFPLETDILAGFSDRSLNGTCLVPCFPEGGRITRDNIHLVRTGNTLVPVGETPYAADAQFGFGSSDLRVWIEEKTKGRTRPEEVVSIRLEDLRAGNGHKAYQKLMSGDGPGRYFIINAADYHDLDIFAGVLHKAEQAGLTFLCRSAASFIKTYSGTPDVPLLERKVWTPAGSGHGGLVVFGSHVPVSTAQFNKVRTLGNCGCVELPVRDLADGTLTAGGLGDLARQLDTIIRQGDHAVLFTSRETVSGTGAGARLLRTISDGLVTVVRKVRERPAFVLTKGGITSHGIARHGLGIKEAMVAGQAIPGVPVWECGDGSRWPGLYQVVFPGNVGEENTVADLLTSPAGN